MNPSPGGEPIFAATSEARAQLLVPSSGWETALMPAPATPQQKGLNTSSASTPASLIHVPLARAMPEVQQRF